MSQQPPDSESLTLKRTLSLPLLVFYGLGTTIGAGIYALVGELAGISGYLAPLSFLFAGFLAALTAASFSELSSRFPKAGGAAVFVDEGFGLTWLTLLAGIGVIAAGVVSSAALMNAFVGYFVTLFQLQEIDPRVLLILVTLALGGLAAWGIAESARVAALLTLLEVGGLVLVIGAGIDRFGEVPLLVSRAAETVVQDGFAHSATLLLGGAMLGFYAFIGFEDMVVVAEEVVQPRRNMPLGILLTLLVTLLLYMAVMVVSLLAAGPGGLVGVDAPLVEVYQQLSGGDGRVIALIGGFAIINGALIQIIMASRVLYGLADRGYLPRLLARVNPATRTPLVATSLVVALVLLMALLGDLVGLAIGTSVLMLSVFGLANLALLRIKLRETEHRSETPRSWFSVPIWVPLVGALASWLMVARELWNALF